MCIALLQSAGEPGRIEPNLALLAERAAAAAAAGARLLVCPEMFLTGYNLAASVVAELAEPAGGTSAQRVAGVARACGIAILYGYAERDGESVYNAAQLIDADGRPLANCRKSDLYGELDRRAFSPGQALIGTRLDGSVSAF